MTDTKNTGKSPEKMQFDDGKIRELVEKRKAAEEEQYPEKACDPVESITHTSQTPLAITGDRRP